MQNNNTEGEDGFECPVSDCYLIFDTKQGAHAHVSKSSEHDAPWRDEALLRNLSIEENLEQKDIANRLGCAKSTVSNAFSDFGIEVDKPWQDPDVLQELYHDQKMPQSQVAKELGCSTSRVCELLNEFGIEARQRGESISRAASSRPASYYVDSTGYERSESTYRGETDSVKIHRLAAVAWFGFDAVCDMFVHHRNEIRWANYESNLLLMTPSDHSRYHNLDDPGDEFGDEVAYNR